MAVKASVNTQNQTTVRVGQQNAIKVSSTAAGISAADSATTAVNVVGGRADVTQLAVSGLSTFTGIVTTASDLYVGGDLYLTDDLVLDNITGNSLTINGISSLGITSATDLEAQQLSISGISTFNDDVVFKGNTSNAKWDSSTNDLILFDGTRLEFGSNKDFEIWHGGSHTFMKNSGGDLRIRGDKILLKREDDSERYLEANVNNEVKLFFNGVDKFQTTLHGVEVTGLTSTTDVLVSGAVTATTFYGDGTNLTNTGAVLSDASGSQRLIVSSLSSGIMTTAATDGDLTWDSSTNTLSATNVSTVGLLTANSLYVSGISTFASGNLLIKANGNHTHITESGAGNLYIKADDLYFNNAAGTVFLGAFTSAGLYINDTILHNGDTDTKIRFPDDGNISFETDGTEALRIAEDQKVGIGTTNPAYTLDLGESPSTIRLVSENDGTALRIGAGGQNNVTLIRVDGGSVAHGETDDSDYGFSLKYMGVRTGNNNSLSLFSDNITGTQFEAITVLQDGKIGIGTTTPQAKLDVVGTLSVSGLSTYIGIATYKDDVFIDGTLTAGAIDGGTY